MSRSYACVLGISLLLPGCSFAFNPTVTVGNSATTLRLLDSGAAQYARLRELAVDDLGCGDAVIERSQTPAVFRARGCGRQRIYLRVVTFHPLERGLPPPEVAETIDFEPLLAHSANEYRHHGHHALADLLRLNRQAAEDLDCPREEVVPQMAIVGHSSGYMSGRTYVQGPPIYGPFAEGCGRRATYLAGKSDPFLLTGKVDAKGAPTGFAPWDGVGESAR